MAITQVQASQLRRAINKRVAAEISWHEAQQCAQTFETRVAERHCTNTREQLDDLIKRLTIYEVFRTRKPSAKKAKP